MTNELLTVDDESERGENGLRLLYTRQCASVCVTSKMIGAELIPPFRSDYISFSSFFMR